MEDANSGFLSICANLAVEVYLLRCESPLDNNGATPMPQKEEEKSLPSDHKSLSHCSPTQKFLLQSKIDLGYSQLIYSIRKVVFSQAFPSLPGLGVTYTYTEMWLHLTSTHTCMSGHTCLSRLLLVMWWLPSLPVQSGKLLCHKILPCICFPDLFEN